MNLGPILPNPHILVADDETTNLKLLTKVLERGGYDRFTCVGSGRKTIEAVATDEIDLIMLDLHMPDLDGYEVLRLIRDLSLPAVFLPILVFTADATAQARTRALELGASDFLTKPGDVTEILLRVRNFLMMRAWHMELHERNADLEAKVRERTKELERSQVEIVARLALAAEYRDEDTADHTQRVGEVSASIAKQMGFPPKFVNLLRLAARLHDIGKIAIPDEILRKPDRLTGEEFERVKIHADVGAAILANGTTPIVQMAERIARAHHEWFDGSGYPLGLAGESIPIEARMVAVADSYDALTNTRPYKRAWSTQEARNEIVSKSGTQFDPKVVNAFMAIGDVHATQVD